MTALVLAACSDDKEPTANDDGANTGEESHEDMDMNEEGSDSSDLMEGHMSHDEVVSLNDSTGENELKIPSILERDDEEGVVYTVRAQKGKTEIFDGIETTTYGYNGAFLGSMIRFEKGDIVKIRNRK